MKEEPKKKKLTLQQLRAAETANDEEVARKLQLNGKKRRKEKACCIKECWGLSFIVTNQKQGSYEEIKDIYEKVKRFNDRFVAIGSTEDEQAIMS
ncbi:hypothetical protein Tco_0812399 [Tanacetum coccineum]